MRSRRAGDARACAACHAGHGRAGGIRPGVAPVQRRSGRASTVPARHGAVAGSAGMPRLSTTCAVRLNVLQRADDPVWTPRTLNAGGLVYLAVGSPDRADADFAAAGRLYAETSQELESIYTVENRALSAFSSGYLPVALSFFMKLRLRYGPPNVPASSLRVDLCAVLLAAGLFGDALAEADAAVRDVEQVHGQADLGGRTAANGGQGALAAAQPQAAVDRAQAAFRSSGRSRMSGGKRTPGSFWSRHATRSARCRRQLLRAANRAAVQLEGLGSGEATQAHLLAGRVALDLGRRDDTDRHLSAAARSRRRGPAMSRASGWLSEALRAEAAGDPAGCSPPAAADWWSWTSTGSPWARRNCEPRPPRTAPSWPRSPSAMPRGRTGRVSCSPGVNAGEPPRSRSRRCGPRPMQG